MFPEMVLENSVCKAVTLTDKITNHSVTLAVIQYAPQIDQDSNPNSDDSQDTVDLGTPCASHEEPSSDEPAPPFNRKLPVAK